MKKKNKKKTNAPTSYWLRANCNSLLGQYRNLPAQCFLHTESIGILLRWNILPPSRWFRSSYVHSRKESEQPSKRSDLQLLCSPATQPCSQPAQQHQLYCPVAQPRFHIWQNSPTDWWKQQITTSQFLMQGGATYQSICEVAMTQDAR